MSEFKKAVSRHTNPVSLVMLCLALAVLAPAIETALFPVVKNVEISNPRGNGSTTLISAKGEKMRDCSWRSTTWYLGDRNGTNVPLRDARHLDAPQDRSKGILFWENIFIPLSQEQIKTDAFADAQHSCYPWVRWYQTRSKFFN